MKQVAMLLLGAALSGAPWMALGANADEINISSDSSPGWRPSQEQRKVIPRLVTEYFSDLDAGRLQAAYGFHGAGMNQFDSFDRFSARESAFNAMAGTVEERRIVKVTWTKDPADAPAPGVYASVDFVSRFANVDRYCGYLVLYRPPSGGDFKIVREEESYLANETARAIEAARSRAAVDKAWAQAVSYCPNYPATADAG